MIDLKALWGTFPPRHEIPRLERYELCRKVLCGEHREAFGHGGAHSPGGELSRVLNLAALGEESQTYLALNYCKTVATTFASKMFGTAPDIRIAAEDDPAQRRFEQILIDNTLASLNLSQAIASVALGGGVYRVRWGRAADWQREMPVIDILPACHYFALTERDNAKAVRAKVLAFELAHGKKRFLKVEIHQPYSVTHELWSLKGRALDKLAGFGSIPGFERLAASADGSLANVRADGLRIVEDTGYPGMLVEYVPNFVLADEHYGRSDYDALMPVQRQINECTSGMIRVLLKHIDPKLILPPGTMRYDERSGKWFVLREDMECVEVPADVGAVLPRYLTWDAQLGAARANLEALFEAFMILADISLPMLGASGGFAESGDAIELRMTQTTDAVQRKRMHYDTALKNLLHAAQWLDHHYGDNPNPPREVAIDWPSPVPMSKAQITDLHAKRLAAGLESRRTAVRAVLGVSGERLNEELRSRSES